MKRAINETNRRRTLQEDYNKEHNITPKTIQKDIRGIIESMTPADTAEAVGCYNIGVMIENLTDEMLAAAEMLEFERAAELRDRIQKLKDKIK